MFLGFIDVTITGDVACQDNNLLQNVTQRALFNPTSGLDLGDSLPLKTEQCKLEWVSGERRRALYLLDNLLEQSGTNSATFPGQ